MRSSRVFVLVVAAGVLVSAQEKPVPSDSTRVTIPGCARGRSFVSGVRPDEPVQSDIAPGRRFRLSGAKELLNDIKKREANMVEVTGLVRKSQLAESPGVSAAGGRVRVGGGPPREALGGVRADVGYNEAVIDLESFRPLPEPCRSK